MDPTDPAPAPPATTDPTATPTSPPASGQGEPPVTPAAPDTPPARTPDQLSLLQGAYTRASMLNAEVLRELGLEKGATVDDVKAAIAALREPDPLRPNGGEPPSLDPRVYEAEARAEAAAWQLQSVMYPEVADAALEIAELVRTTRDPAKLVPAFYKVLQRFEAPAASEPPVTPEPPATAPPATPPTERVDIALAGDAGSGPTARVSQAADLGDLRGSGRVADAVHRIFEKAGAIRPASD